jgi:hypothetical protein
MIIKFETSILLSNKPYCGIPDYFYDNNGRLETKSIWYHADFHDDRSWFRAPSQDELQRWIRTNQGMHVEIYCNASGWGWIITKLNGTTIREIRDDVFFETYEEALEVGLVQALNLIEK